MDNQMTIEERKQFQPEFTLSCSICGGAIHTLVTGCTSKYCPTNKNDPQFTRN